MFCIIDSLKQEVRRHGDKCEIIPIERLKNLKEDIDHFKENEDLNAFQEYIISDIYQFEPVITDFAARSIVMIASPVPAYAKVIFNWQGRKIPLIGLARSYIDKEDPLITTKQYLTVLLKSAGYHIECATNIPLKRLAVRSGLAVYGRNNICYVEGMGSFFTLVSYFTDLSNSEDSWRKITRMDSCENCQLCLKNCPTGAIMPDRFLINNERCLSYFNEGGDDFPDWLPESAHHCLYDCLMCQNICPANRDYINNVIGPIEFDDAETDWLLREKPTSKLPPAMQQRIRALGLDSYLGVIPRNLRVLFENYERGDRERALLRRQFGIE